MMANRSDRQLMRQRGAGSREVNSVDFTFNFGGTGSRSERQLMRQRGAGNRNIDNVDFGFSFPTPSNRSRPSRSKTPQTGNPKAANNSGRTPARASRESSQTRSNTRTSEGRVLGDPRSQTAFGNTVHPEVTAKRRILTPSNGNVSQERANMPLIQNTAQARVDNGSMDSIRDKITNNELTNSIENNAGILGDDNDYDNMYQTDGPDKENQTTVLAALEKKRALSKHNEMQRQNARGTNPAGNAIDRDSLPNGSRGKSSGKLMAAVESDLQAVETTENTRTKPDSNLSATVSASDLKKRKRKRKSVVLGRKKRRSSGNTTLSIIEDETQIRQVPTPTPSGENESDTDETSLETASASNSDEYRRTNAGRPDTTSTFSRLHASRPVSEEAELRQIDDDEDADETYVPDGPTPAATPAPKRKRGRPPKNRPFEAGNNSDDATQPPLKRRKSSFPIVTHRITNAHILPTITEEIDARNNNSDGDEQNFVPSTFSMRAQPNAVDVLSQICRETIASSITKLQESTTGRSTVKSQTTALQIYSDALESQFFQHSQALEHMHILESRYRKARREKTELQARWMEIRRQRDIMALRADAIRKENWEKENAAKKLFELSESAERVEIEMGRETSEADEVNLELLLRSVAVGASKRGADGSGNLEKIKSFNRALETLAVSLERR